MDPRRLDKLLATLRANGVTSVQFDAELQPVRIDFGASPVIVPDGEDVQVEPGTPEWTSGTPMALAEAYARIKGTYEKKAKA